MAQQEGANWMISQAPRLLHDPPLMAPETRKLAYKMGSDQHVHLDFTCRELCESNQAAGGEGEEIADKRGEKAPECRGVCASIFYLCIAGDADKFSP